jgi:hypothetical protein
MDRIAFLLRLALTALLVAAPWPLLAATPATQATGRADLLHPLTLQKVEDMDFATIIVSGAGTAVIDPSTNTMATTGGALLAAGTPHAAHFRGAASSNAVVIIKLPKQPVTMTRVGGTQTISLSKFTLDGPSKRTMAQIPTFEFRVGGTITLAAGQAQGTYVGTFDVTAQYP